jgi:hypothetical protein
VTAPFVDDAFLKSVIDGWRTNLNDLKKNFRKIRGKAKKIWGKGRTAAGWSGGEQKGAPPVKDAPVGQKAYI